MIKGPEVTSATIRRWIKESDITNLEGAVLEGHGEKVKAKALDAPDAQKSIQNYINDTIPQIQDKIRVIHAAVSTGDLPGLQNHLVNNDYALAKVNTNIFLLYFSFYFFISYASTGSFRNGSIT